MPSPSSSSLPASGIAPVDSAWGGFTSGRTYLLVGHARSGRMQLMTQVLQAGTAAGESALLVSARAPEVLVKESNTYGFDLAAAYRTGHVRLLRVPTAAELVPLGDEGLSQALDDLGDLARAQQPGRLVVDDFTAFVQFRTFAAFEAALKRLVAAAREAGTVLVLGFGEPANEGSRRLLAAVEDLVAGSVRIAASAGGSPTLTLVPPPAPSAPAASQPPRFRFTETPLAAAEPAPTAPATAPTPASPTPAAPTTPPEEPAYALPSSDGFGSHASPEPEMIIAAPAAPASRPDAPLSAAPLASPPPTAVPTPAPPAPIQPVAAPAPEPEPQAPLAPEPQVPAPDPIAEAYDSMGIDASIIRPIDPGTLPFPSDDPFGQYLGPDLLTLGHFVDSDVNGATEAAHEPVPMPVDAPAASPEDIYRQVFAPRSMPAAPPPPAPEPTTHLPLRRALQEAFGTRNTRPFMVLALRFENDSPYADLMPAIGEALRAALGDRGVLEADIAVPRTVAFLPGVDGDAAPLLFEAIQSYLRAVAPQRADAALAAINALVVPNGQPFNSANELIDYIFEH